MRYMSKESTKPKRAINPKIAKLLAEKGVITLKDTQKAKISRNELSNMAKEGYLTKLKGGVYESKKRKVSEHESLIDVCAQAPKAVITLISALQFHELTTQNPHQVWVAFPRGQRVSKIEYPPIRHVIYSESPYYHGIEEHQIQGVLVRVYSVAKTVADCFKYRNKIGLDVAIEALKESLEVKKTTLDELWLAAKICRVQNVMRPYMEMLTNV